MEINEIEGNMTKLYCKRVGIPQAKKKEIEHENTIKKELPKEQEPKEQGLKPREAFEVQNSDWIDFLNDRKSLEKIIKASATDEKWKSLDGKKTGIETIEQKQEFLTQWQTENDIIEPIQSNRGRHIQLEGYRVKFESHGEIIRSCHSFMYENLKSISRGETTKFREVDNFGEDEANALLLLLTPFFLTSPVEGRGYYFYAPWIKTQAGIGFLFNLSQLIASFLEYFNELYLGRNAYKIGVCRYQKRNLPECGRVFIGGKKTSEVCQEHQKLWWYGNVRKKHKIEKV